MLVKPCTARTQARFDAWALGILKREYRYVGPAVEVEQHGKGDRSVKPKAGQVRAGA